MHRVWHAPHYPRDTKSTYSLGRRVKELSRNEQPSVIPRKQLRIYSDSIRARRCVLIRIGASVYASVIRRCVLIRIGASVYASVIFSQSPQDRSGDREHRGGLARSKSKVDSFLREVIINVIHLCLKVPACHEVSPLTSHRKTRSSHMWGRHSRQCQDMSGQRQVWNYA